MATWNGQAKPYDKVKFSKKGKVHRVRMILGWGLVTTCKMVPDDLTTLLTDEPVSCKDCLRDWNIETDDKYK